MPATFCQQPWLLGATSHHCHQGLGVGMGMGIGMGMAWDWAWTWASAWAGTTQWP